MRNIFRMFSNANLFDEVIALLSDPIWLLKQMKEFGWMQADNNIAEMLMMMEKDKEKDDRGEMKICSEMVRAALLKSEHHILSSPASGMFSTEMNGRLYHYRACSLVVTFSAQVEQHIEVLWLNSQGAFPARQPLFAKLLEIGNVRLVHYGYLLIAIVSFDDDNKKFRLS